MDDGRLHQAPVIGDRGRGQEDLQGGPQHISLSHAGEIGITRGPVLTLINPFPGRVGDQTG